MVVRIISFPEFLVEQKFFSGRKKRAYLSGSRKIHFNLPRTPQLSIFMLDLISPLFFLKYVEFRWNTEAVCSMPFLLLLLELRLQSDFQRSLLYGKKISASMPYFGLIIDYLRSFLVFVFKVFSIINEKISAQNSILITTVLFISPIL